MSPTTCPPRSELECLFLGGLSEEQSSVLEQHVLECRSCLTTLGQLSESRDTLAAMLRDDALNEPIVPDAETRRLMQRLRSNAPARVSPKSEGTSMVSLPCPSCRKVLSV